ncbi:MAG: hypothetical protein KH029_02575 [Haemophilus parainfluenzae]|jgi:hypothetical protein|nr:hypothetical protein [Haemophilus parainfluenzae]
MLSPAKLTDKTDKGNSEPSLLLTNRNSILFRMSIEHSLENGYDFKKLNSNSLKDLHTFIENTIGKNLTISEVEQLFLRTKGDVFSNEVINGLKRKIIHFGKDRNSFRIHGYYNEQNNFYFVICKIDPNHKVNK